MPRPNHTSQTGYFSFAQNNANTNYLDLCYVQALSLKSTQLEAQYAVGVNPGTRIPSKYNLVFDHVVEISNPSPDPFMDEWKVFHLTPFKETFKVEADILFNTPNDHWWQGIRKHHHLLFTSKVQTYDHKVARSRYYRKLFDDNLLPDIYNGLMYFRYTRETQVFFNKAREIFVNWEFYKTMLSNCAVNEPPTTDVVYALAVKLLDIEDTCINPALDYPTFVHMKAHMQEIPDPWYESTHFNLDNTMMTIGHYKQFYPLHYQNKKFITDNIVKHYEKVLGI